MSKTPLDTPSIGNIRLNIISDSVNLNVEYKFEDENGIISRYIAFYGVVKFFFSKEKFTDIDNNIQYDVIYEEKTIKFRFDAALNRYVCLFSDHGFLEVLATSFEHLREPTPTMAELFSKFIGPDF